LARHGRRLSHHGLSHGHEVERGVVDEDVVARASHLDGFLQTLTLTRGETAEEVGDAAREAPEERERPGVTQAQGEACRDAATAAAIEVVHLTATVAQIGAGAGEGGAAARLTVAATKARIIEEHEVHVVHLHATAGDGGRVRHDAVRIHVDEAAAGGGGLVADGAAADAVEAFQLALIDLCGVHEAAGERNRHTTLVLRHHDGHGREMTRRVKWRAKTATQ